MICDAWNIKSWLLLFPPHLLLFPPHLPDQSLPKPPELSNEVAKEKDPFPVIPIFDGNKSASHDYCVDPGKKIMEPPPYSPLTPNCNVWDEGEAGSDAQEVGSCLVKHVMGTLSNNVKHLILWSDSCSGQNRNIKLTLMLKALLNDHPTLQKISLWFNVENLIWLKISTATMYRKRQEL
jgi:hypothetical protein